MKQKQNTNLTFYYTKFLAIHGAFTYRRIVAESILAKV